MVLEMERYVDGAMWTGCVVRGVVLAVNFKQLLSHLQ